MHKENSDVLYVHKTLA